MKNQKFSEEIQFLQEQLDDLNKSAADLDAEALADSSLQDEIWKVEGQIQDLLSKFPKPKPLTVGQIIRAARRAAGLSQVECAKAAGIDKNTLSAIENGRGNTTIKMILALIQVLEVQQVVIKKPE